jgi:hypothetical protein
MIEYIVYHCYESAFIDDDITIISSGKYLCSHCYIEKAAYFYFSLAKNRKYPCRLYKVNYTTNAEGHVVATHILLEKYK